MQVLRYGCSYDEWYFEQRYRYLRKKRAIQRHYRNILVWANRHAPHNILRGSGKSALDIGCALGFVVGMLHELGYEAVGVDISKYAVRRGNQIGYMNLVLSNAELVPFKASSFDLVTCFELLEHVQFPRLTLDSAYEVLREGGVLLVSTPAVGLAATVISSVYPQPSYVHQSVKPPSKWIKILTDVGFLNIKAESFSILPVPPTLLGRYCVFKCGPMLASHVRIVATKPLKD